jgi:hypothetical protein
MFGTHTLYRMGTDAVTIDRLSRRAEKYVFKYIGVSGEGENLDKAIC